MFENSGTRRLMKNGKRKHILSENLGITAHGYQALVKIHPFLKQAKWGSIIEVGMGIKQKFKQ